MKTKLFLFTILISALIFSCQNNPDTNDNIISTVETEKDPDRFILPGGEWECYYLNFGETTANPNIPCPACVYCQLLGYQVDLVTGMVTFPDNSQCEHWDFYRGECGQQWSYCEQQGYRIETITEDMGSWMAKYALCRYDDSSCCLEQDFILGRCQPGQCEHFSLSNGCCNYIDAEAYDLKPGQ